MLFLRPKEISCCCIRPTVCRSIDTCKSFLNSVAVSSFVRSICRQANPLHDTRYVFCQAYLVVRPRLSIHTRRISNRTLLMDRTEILSALLVIDIHDLHHHESHESMMRVGFGFECIIYAVFQCWMKISKIFQTPRNKKGRVRVHVARVKQARPPEESHACAPSRKEPFLLIRRMFRLCLG